MRPLKVLLGDLSYFNKHTRTNTYTPENIGFLTSYAKRQFGKDIDVRLTKDAGQLLEHAKTDKPDIVALALYFWNSALDRAVVKDIRKAYGKDVTVVLGGPSVDTDAGMQASLFSRFPEADVLIPNEGEVGLANVISAALSGTPWGEPIDGATFRKGGQLVIGKEVGLNTDLSLVDSPYLSGLLDPYLDTIFQPLVQTSRLCPYTCAFCVSGKTRGKLRAFPLEQIKEEITFLARRFKDRPHFMLTLSDENFGILERDIELAEHIRKCSRDIGWPQNAFFYNDKRFTEKAREVVRILGPINNLGMALALQSENPEALKAVNRKNLTDEQIDEAIRWAASENIAATTELIFGLPYETKASFTHMLEKSVARGFDSVLCNNLFIMDGIEMARPAYRDKYQLQTRFRILGTNYGELNGQFTAEYEEVVVGSKDFDFKDYMLIRSLNLLFYSAYNLYFYKWFFNFIRHLGVPLVEFFERLMYPDRTKPWPAEYLKFVDDVHAAFSGELLESKEAVHAKAKRIFDENHGDVGEPDRLNVYLGSRLIYREGGWVNGVFKTHLKEALAAKGLPVAGATPAELDAAIDAVLEVCSRERINLRSPERRPHERRPVRVAYDFIQWKKDKYKYSLLDRKIEPRPVLFELDDSVLATIKSFNRDFGAMPDNTYFYSAFDFIVPKSRLLYKLAFAPKPVSV